MLSASPSLSVVSCRIDLSFFFWCALTQPVVVQGIVLFTFDKYSKSLDSNVPLDAHGNPVTGDVDDVDSTEGEMRPVVDEERVGLTSEAGSQGEFEEVSQKKEKGKQ